MKEFLTWSLDSFSQKEVHLFYRIVGIDYWRKIIQHNRIMLEFIFAEIWSNGKFSIDIIKFISKRNDILLHLHLKLVIDTLLNSYSMRIIVISGLSIKIIIQREEGIGMVRAFNFISKSFTTIDVSSLKIRFLVDSKILPTIFFSIFQSQSLNHV